MNPAKTELLWAGSEDIPLLGSYAAALELTLESDTVRSCTGVRSHDLIRKVYLKLSGLANWLLLVPPTSLFPKVTNQRRRKKIGEKPQRMLNADACVVSDTGKIDRGLMSLLHDELHWLDVTERVTYKLDIMTCRCLHIQVPRYLAHHRTPASDVASRLRLRSANRHQLIVPRCQLIAYGGRGFSIASPTRSGV